MALLTSVSLAPSHILLVLALAVTIYLARALYQYRLDAGKLPLPPTPPGHPIIGNMVEVIKSTGEGTQHLLFGRYARDYGSVVRVKVGPFIEYFLNTDAAVKELFDKQSSATAERPRWIVSNEHICNQKNVLLLNASEPRWKHQRKVIHAGMTSVPRADAGIPYLHYETAKFLYEVANNPSLGRSAKDLFNSIGRYTYSTFACQTFGMDIPDADNPVIEYIYETGLAQIIGTLPGSHIVDLLPVLDKLPLFLKPWERQGRQRFKRDLAWCVERLQRVRELRAKGVVEDSFLPNIVNDEKSMGFESEEEAAYLALQLIMGAADTSKMSTWSFMEAMMTFPDVQEKARQEIEKVVGDRLPVYEDLNDIPYIRCIMKEVWRWRAPVSLGHPHRTTRELTFDGYRIPKGARLHLNAWAIHRNPDRYEDPERFWPERYANDPTTTMQSINSSDVKNRDHFAFGSGRRVCPGYHVAERSLAVAMMRILWAFKIAPLEGTPMPLTPESYPGEMPGNRGETMPVTLTVLSEEKRKLINQAFQEAEKARSPVEPLA